MKKLQVLIVAIISFNLKFFAALYMYVVNGIYFYHLIPTLTEILPVNSLYNYVVFD